MSGFEPGFICSWLRARQTPTPHHTAVLLLQSPPLGIILIILGHLLFHTKDAGQFSHNTAEIQIQMHWNLLANEWIAESFRASHFLYDSVLSPHIQGPFVFRC